MPETLEEYIKQKDAPIRVFVLTIIGIALNSVLAIPAYQEVFTLMFGSTIGQSTTLVAFFFLTLIITPIYCWAASIAFHPKRLVNPLYVQVTTAGIVTLFITLANARQFASLQDFVGFFSGIIAVFVLAIFFLLVFGILQLVIVRWLVGLVGTIEDLDRKTFLVDADFETLSGIVLSESFLGAWNLEHRKLSKNKNMIEVYTSYGYLWQIRLVLSPSPNEPNKSILAAVAFEKRFYTILKSPCVSDYRDDMIRRIESVIGKKLEPTEFNNEASHFALRTALAVTEPKTIMSRSEFGEVPTFYRNILILMGIITVVVIGLFVVGFIGLELFATSIIMIIVALAIELGPRLKEIIDSQRAG